MEATPQLVKKDIKTKLSKLKKEHQNITVKLNVINKDLHSIQREMNCFLLPDTCKKEKQVKSKELVEFDSYDFNEVTELCYQYFIESKIM
jgi:hypothetical protein